MHILYVVQYFNLPHEPGGGRAYHFARHWAQRGNRVTVVAGALNHKTASVPEARRGRLFSWEQVDGIDVVYCASSARIRNSIAGRLLNFFGFALLSTWLCLFRVRRPDVVYASSTPLTVGLPGCLASVRWRVPFVFEVRDLWPESAIVAGVLRNRLAIGLARWLERFLYRRASHIVAVTRGIRDGIVKCGIPGGKVQLVPNGVDDLLLSEPQHRPPSPNGRFFQCIYVGALGRWNGNGTILEAARHLREDPVEFVFVGDGDQRGQMEEQVRSEGLSNIRFMGALPKQEAMEHLHKADAALICTWDHPFHRMVLANKIFDYLAAGKPIVAAADGEMVELLLTSGAGIAVPPGPGLAMARAIRQLIELPEDARREMGRRGRAHVLANYRRSDLAEQVEHALRQLAHEAS